METLHGALRRTAAPPRRDPWSLCARAALAAAVLCAVLLAALTAACLDGRAGSGAAPLLSMYREEHAAAGVPLPAVSVANLCGGRLSVVDCYTRQGESLTLGCLTTLSVSGSLLRVSPLGHPPAVQAAGEDGMHLRVAAACANDTQGLLVALGDAPAAAASTRGAGEGGSVVVPLGASSVVTADPSLLGGDRWTYSAASASLRTLSRSADGSTTLWVRLARTTVTRVEESSGVDTAVLLALLGGCAAVGCVVYWAVAVLLLPLYAVRVGGSVMRPVGEPPAELDGGGYVGQRYFLEEWGSSGGACSAAPTREEDEARANCI